MITYSLSLPAVRQHFLSLLSAALILGSFSCKTSKPAGYDDKHPILLDTMNITVPRDNPYRATATQVHDLIHTKLEVRFDWDHQWLFGKAYVTVKPHFYAQTSLVLDAKNMDIYKVALVKADGSLQPLTYTYDSLQLTMQLDKEYTANDKYTVYVEYKSKPNERTSGGSEAIQDDKGLYFINPLGKDTDKPKEIWTQGETESNSNWFPTLDKPNFKGTNEIYITVDKKYTTLSNGLLLSQKDNGDGTRTDYWKMDLPHSPYLIMMAIGEFIVTKDHWRGKEVSYYIEPKYAPYTQKMFGETPAMMEYFSNLLGVEYPWQKYAQVVARDYVSGAMENTSATLHGENLNRTPRQMLDEDYHDYISHELFHQWFGDYVTAESWSNITVNETMADYSEYLWNAHRYGREYADWKFSQARQKYLRETKQGKNVDLVRFYYDDREDMFDAHSYEKGGQIQQMLRNVVGDSAYFKSLNLYLQSNRFRSAEAHQLRLAFEEVTGRDMNWFWNQWYFNNGHPLLTFDYSYANDSVYVKVSQKHSTDKPLTYELPFRIDIHYGNIITSNKVVLKKRKQTFAFKALGKPDLIDADAERVLLCEKTENKTIDQYIFQYRNGSLFMQRYEALDSLRRQQRGNGEVGLVFREALHDRNEALRAFAAKYIAVTSTNKDTVLPMLQALVEKDSASHVRAAAVEALGKQKAKNYIATIEKALGDSSYLAASAALTALSKVDSAGTLAKVKWFEHEAVFDIKNASYEAVAKLGDASYNSYFTTNMKKEKGYTKYFLLYHYANYLCRMDADMVSPGIEAIKQEALDSTDKKQQLQTFATGAIERIKENYERRKVNNESVKNSDRKTRSKYDMAQIEGDLVKIDAVIAKATEALAALKKKDE